MEGIDNIRDAMDRLTKVFGIISVSPALKTDKNMAAIENGIRVVMEDAMAKYGVDNLTFKVESRRSDKSFPKNSMELNRELGAFVLREFPYVKVDVHNPEVLLSVEVREWTYVYHEVIDGAGGMPVGTNGKATLLLSGGIDSPVAGWMIAKRGVELSAVYYHSVPYTSERAKKR